MHVRFEQRIEEGLRRIATTCRRQRLSPAVVGQRVGRLLGRNSRAAGLFAVEVKTDGKGRESYPFFRRRYLAAASSSAT